MITTFADPFHALLSLQRDLESRFASDWLQDTTTSRGPFPPINVFQQRDDVLALMELPGIDKNELQIEAKLSVSLEQPGTVDLIPAVRGQID